MKRHPYRSQMHRAPSHHVDAHQRPHRREVIRRTTSLGALSLLAASGFDTLANSAVAEENDETKASDDSEFRFNYILASCLYGYVYLGEILPEARKVGASAIDIWPKKHGNQREQLDDLGEQRFAELLQQHQVQLGCITQYALGPFGLRDEIKLAARMGCKTIVTGAIGPKKLRGQELKVAVETFVEQMKPHLEVAAEHEVTIAIENHANNLIESADALKWLADLRPNRHLAIALAPYHLPQNAHQLGKLIRTLGPAMAMFYAWEHGNGCMEKLPKEQELLQLPGRGSLDFQPMVEALRAIKYEGWTEIFMHPVPRGISVLPSVEEVTKLVNESRTYLSEL